MYDFNYQKAGCVADAGSALKAADDGKVMAGGMTLLPTMKQRLAAPSDVIDLGGISGLGGVAWAGGARHPSGPHRVPPLLRWRRGRGPDRPPYIDESYPAHRRQKLRQSELDAIIIALPFEEPEVVTLPLYDEPFVVLLPGGHPLTKRDSLTAEELAKEQLLLLGPGHCFRDQVLESCPPLVDAVTRNPSAAAPSLVTEGSSLETIRHMVASGLGITVLPLSAATAMQYDESILAVRPFAAPVPYRTVALAWRVTFPRPKAIDVLSLAASQCRVIEKAKIETPAAAATA